MKWIIRFFLVILGFFTVVSCSDSAGDEPDPGDGTTVRTVLVYMAANNSLSPYSYGDLGEMFQGKPADNTRWLVYLTQKNDKNPQLIEFCGGDTTVLKVYGPQSSASLSRMTEVFDDMARCAPAQKYGLVLWSHGSGWVIDGIDEDLPDDPYSLSPLSFGQDGTQWMNISTVRAAVKGRGFDYIYFDACYMNAVEVAYELRDAVDYIVGSVSELPAYGMPYNQNMKLLGDGSKAALIEAAANTFGMYASEANPVSRTCTMSVISTAALVRLAKATKAIYELTSLGHPAEYKTNYSVKGLSVNAYDFGEYVSALAEAHNLDRTLVNEFNDALDDAVIYKAATKYIWNERPIYSTSGLSTYVFETPGQFNIREGYGSTQWAKDVAIYHIHD